MPQRNIFRESFVQRRFDILVGRLQVRMAGIEESSGLQIEEQKRLYVHYVDLLKQSSV